MYSFQLLTKQTNKKVITDCVDACMKQMINFIPYYLTMTFSASPSMFPLTKIDLSKSNFLSFFFFSFWFSFLINKYKLILCKCISSYFPFVCPMMICVCVFIYHFFSLHSMIWNEKKIEIKSNQICNISYFMVIKSFVFLF